MKTARANGIHIAFHETGSGAPLLLLHGFSLDHSIWNPQIESLQRSYRIIAPDLRGMGQTDFPGGQISVAQMADDAAGLLGALDISAAAVAGFSLGGYVLLEMLMRHPLKVRAAAFISTRASADAAQASDQRLRTMRLLIDRGMSDFADEFIPQLFSDSYFSGNPDEVEEVRRVVTSQHPMAIASVLDAIRLRENMVPRLREISVPCAVFGSTDDKMISVQETEELRDGLKDTTFDMIEGAGHTTPFECAGRVSFQIDQLMQRAGMWM